MPNIVIIQASETQNVYENRLLFSLKFFEYLNPIIVEIGLDAISIYAGRLVNDEINLN